MVRHAARPRPDEVAGYALARANGVTPTVPPSPPTPSVVPSARRALGAVRVTLVAAVGVVSVLLLAISHTQQVSWTGVVVLLAAAAVASAVLARALRRWGRSQLAELADGYTTTTFELGRWWLASSPDGPWTHGWVQWDWTAVWVLREDGTVLAAPRGTGYPPGMYPSPHGEGRLELWSGCQWAGLLRQEGAGASAGR